MICYRKGLSVLQEVYKILSFRENCIPFYEIDCTREKLLLLYKSLHRTIHQGVSPHG